MLVFGFFFYFFNPAVASAFYDFCACSLKHSISWDPVREPSLHREEHTMLLFAERFPLCRVRRRLDSARAASRVPGHRLLRAGGVRLGMNSWSVAWCALCESVNCGLRRGWFLPELLPAGLGLSLCTECPGPPRKGLSLLMIDTFCQESGFAGARQLHSTAQESQ